MSGELSNAVSASHQMLFARIADTNLCSFPRRARDQHVRVDAFLIAACRHVSSVSTVLANEMARLGQEEQARRLTAEYHGLLLALLRAKGRLCGASQLASTPWRTTWGRVVERLETLAELEGHSVLALTATHAPETLARLAHKMSRNERSAPTRPHPFIPMRGVSGRLAMSLCSRLDALWDSLEGRPSPPFSAGLPALAP